MYEQYYGFREKPFSILPDPGFLYLSSKHRKALAMLEYGVVNQAGFSVITGGVGCGKTTLIRELLNKVKNDINVGLVSNTQCGSFEELLQWILFAFDLQYKSKEKVELYETFGEFLVKEYSENRRVVLIVDEAQHLGPDSLEQLRMLSNVNVEKRQVLQLILVGQPDLWNLLKKPELHQFAQRIAVDFFLEPLSEKETRKYIRHRIKVAEGDMELFDEATYHPIWKYTGGVPRLINLLCDTALVYGMAEELKTIDEGTIIEVVKDKQNGLSGGWKQQAMVDTRKIAGLRSIEITSIEQQNSQDVAFRSRKRKKTVTPGVKSRKNSTIEKYIEKK